MLGVRIAGIVAVDVGARLVRLVAGMHVERLARSGGVHCELLRRVVRCVAVGEICGMGGV